MLAFSSLLHVVEPHPPCRSFALCTVSCTLSAGEASSDGTGEHAYNLDQLWDAYKKAQESIWTAGEVDLAKDRIQWRSALSQDERDFLSVIFAFFAAADGIVVENLAQKFCAEVQIPEARCFYGVQMMM